MASRILVSICKCNTLFPDDNKPSPETMVTIPQEYICIFCCNFPIVHISFENYVLKWHVDTYQLAYCVRRWTHTQTCYQIWYYHCHWGIAAFATKANVYVIKADSRLAPSQWETSLQSNAVLHWLCVNLKSAPCYATDHLYNLNYFAPQPLCDKSMMPLMFLLLG